MFDRIIDGKKKSSSIVSIVKGLLDNSEDYVISIFMENGELIIKVRQKETPKAENLPSAK